MNIVVLPGTFHRPLEILSCVESIVNTQKNVNIYVILDKEEEIKIHLGKRQTLKTFLTSQLKSVEFNTFINNYEHFHSHDKFYIKNEFLTVFYLLELMKKENLSQIWTVAPSTLVLNDFEEISTYVTIDVPKMGYLSETHHIHTALVTIDLVQHYCDFTNQLFGNENSKQVMKEIYENMAKNKQPGGICTMTIWDWINNDCFEGNKGFTIRPLQETMLDDSIFDADFSQYNKHFSQLVKIENIFENDYTTIEDQEKQLKTVNHKKVFRKPNLFGVYYRSSQNSSKGSILSGSKTIHKVNSIHFNEQNETLQLVFWNTIRTTFFPGLIPQSSPCPAELQTYQTTIHSLNETKNKQRIHQNY